MIAMKKWFLIYSFVFLALSSISQNKFALVIHGGAGNITQENISEAKQKQYVTSLEKALSIGYSILKKGGTSEEAVIATIQYMEEDTLFNAGRGAVFTHNETNELDASIMSGNDKNAGAVAGVSRIKSPIEAAALVKNKSKHVMLSGKGAEKFAKNNNLEMVAPTYFETISRKKTLQNVKRKNASGQRDLKGQFEKHGTVGCVALDQKGNITAGTSTGGMTNKQYGRIGDSPIIGAGTYADNSTCGVSCTGHGEYFIRNVIAFDIAAQLEYGNKSLTEATQHTIHKKLAQTKGTGGIIAIDKDGNISIEFNTKGMFRAYQKEGEQPKVGLFKSYLTQ